MITPGEQFKLLEQERDDLLEEYQKVLSVPVWRQMIGVSVAGVTCFVGGLLFPVLLWPLVAVLFGYIAVDIYFDIRAFRDRRRRVRALNARYEMLVTWTQKYQ